MKNIIRSLVFSVFTLGVASVHADLIDNGSFENPTAPSGSFTQFTGGTNIGGWTVVGTDTLLVHTAFMQNGITFQLQDGNNWLDLSGATSNVLTNGVTQNATTQIGTSYELSFYVGSATDNSAFFASTVDLSIDGGGRQSFTNPTAPNNMLNWMRFTVPFTA